MKKYGKYERGQTVKMTADVSEKKADAKQPQVKSMLLRTYFTSLLCLVLCMTMFFGTSYAWFTSEVNNPKNEIYVGTLDVGLKKVVESGVQDLAEDNVNLFDKNIRWEPGYTTVETIQVVNKGDLAFNYVITFTDGTLDNAGGVSLDDVAQFFDVWVFDPDETYVAPTSYDAITETGSGWEPVGKLNDVLNGKTVLSGTMDEVRNEDQTVEGTFDGSDTVNEHTIALHMNESATSAVMGRKISLNVKLVAYQKSSEPDEFGNSYDNDIAIATDAEELKESLKNNGNVILSSNIALTNADECVTMAAEILDGNGKTITYSGETNANGNSVGVVNTSGGKISNLTINGGENGRAMYVTKLTSDLVVSDCTLSGAYSFNLTSTTKNDNAIISFIDTKFTSWTSYDNVANHVYFTGCEFANVLRPYGDTTLTNCTFTTAGLDVSRLEAGEVITLINCTYNGQPIEKAVLTSNGEVVTISESDVIKVDTEKMVVLNDNA